MKNVLITGVSRGIGRTLAQRFHKLGFHIYGGYKWSEAYQDEQAEADSLKSELANLTLLPYDLAENADVSALLGHLEGVELHGIINNAAEFLDNSAQGFNEDYWARSIAVNLSAPLLLSIKLKDNLAEGSSIVNIASTDAYFAAYDDIGYAASKAGLISVTKSLAAAFADKKIRVNAVAPGWVDTNMAQNADVSEFSSYQTPLGRNATTEEIADVVEYFMSDKASFITASVINADGGYSSVDYTVKKESEA